MRGGAEIDAAGEDARREIHHVIEGQELRRVEERRRQQIERENGDPAAALRLARG